MKKLTVIIIFLLLAILVSCSETALKREQIELPISVTANLAGTESPFTADITESECTITFDENHALAGTRLKFGSDGGIATVGNFTREVEADIFPAQKALVDAIRLINTNAESGIETESATKYTIDEMTVMVYYDKDSGSITAIKTEENGRTFDFRITALKPYEIQSDSTG